MTYTVGAPDSVCQQGRRPPSEELSQFAVERQHRRARIVIAGTRHPGPSRMSARAYNAFCQALRCACNPIDRTSLIVDPPDGRIPPVDTRGAGAICRLGGHRQDGREAPPLHRSRQWVWYDGYHQGRADRLVVTPTRRPGWTDETPSAVSRAACPTLSRSATTIMFRLCRRRVMSRLPHRAMQHHVRVISLDGRPHLPQDIRQWMGRFAWPVGSAAALFAVRSNVSRQEAHCQPGSFDGLHLVARYTRLRREHDQLRIHG